MEVIQSRLNLKLAYTNYLATGIVTPNGSSRPYLFTNIVSIGDTQYHCAVAVEALQADVFLAMTTNQQFIFFYKKRSPMMIPSTGPYRAKLFSPGI